MNKKKRLIVLASVIILLVLGMFLSCILGSSDIEIGEVLGVIKAKLLSSPGDEIDKSIEYIVWELRLPRAILALAVGGGLAIAGAVMQAITQNVMADPYILGVSSGSLAAISVAYYIGGMLQSNHIILTLFAFGGGMLSILLVYLIGGFGKSKSVNRLILSGMAVSITLNAIAQFFISMQPDSVKVQSVMSWMMGSLAGARWSNIGLPFLGIIVTSAFFCFVARSFDLLALGDDTAISLGTNVKWVKNAALFLVSFITGLAVASGGLIGLVGFVIPHIVRFMIGTDHRKLFPIVFLVGGLFLLIMDILSRTIMAPKEVPIGVFTALCGGPFFIWLLKKKNTALK